MMRITRIEPVTKTKYRVSVDEQFAFVVYKGELSRFHLKEECELTEDTYAKIKEVLLKRACYVTAAISFYNRVYFVSIHHRAGV